MKKIKLGLFGLGHLGKIHLKCLQEISEIDLIGFYDPSISSDFNGIKCFDTEEELFGSCEAVDIVASTKAHVELILRSIAINKHIFVEKPMVASLAEANLIKPMINNNNQCVFQVGHVERFNPAYQSINDIHFKPLFIEVDRLAPYNLRGTDVSVIMDVMIHDLDIILALVDDRVVNVYANGVNILSDSPDICNARIEFENGCVANVTASRISLKQMRKFRVFSQEAYISLDFLQKKSQIVKISDQSSEISKSIEVETKKGKKYVTVEEPLAEESNAILIQLKSFAQSIILGAKPNVGFESAYKAIELADKISHSVEKNVYKIT